MYTGDIRRIVDEINTYIASKPWLDFWVSQYVNKKLVIAGSIDPSGNSDIEIVFSDVFFMSLPVEWGSDTSKGVFQLLEGIDAREINLRFRVEQGYSIFRFIPEDYPEEFGCLIGAKKISYSISEDNT